VDSPSILESSTESLNEILLDSGYFNSLPSEVEDPESNAEISSAAFNDNKDVVKYFLAQGTNPCSTNLS
jgi:hypothetical protein